MMTQIALGKIAVDVVKKDIKNLHLSVYPPSGRVRISAPLRMDLDRNRIFAISKLPWIRQQQKKVVDQERESPREYLERESHYVWGKLYLLKIREVDHAAPKVEVTPSKLLLQIRPGTSVERREEILDEWYRVQLRQAAPAIIHKWEPLLGVKVDRIFVQRMKTKWGSCSRTSPSIRLNTDLAKKPAECLEYVIVHEMAHLLEPTHNKAFVALMDYCLPKWRHRKDQLNNLPLRHETW